MTDRDRKRLSGCRSDLIAKIEAVMHEMDVLGHPMFIVSGWRSAAEQVLLYAKGRTAPGRIVTHADGLRNKSNHQTGRAADLAFVGAEPYAESHPWEEFGQAAERVGLVWGGRWKTPDRPHVELPSTNSVLNA